MKSNKTPTNEISLGIIKADIISARSAMDYFLEKGNKDIKNIAAYHLQQAAEKLIKYQIYENAISVDNAKIYTHNIEALILYAETLGIGIIIPKLIKDNSLVITKWEAGSRYGLGISVRIDTLEKYYAVIDAWFKQVKKSGSTS
jgi:HEPN domain-containing protein